MIRKIIKIDKDKCNGCGLCVSACHEGAIGMADGKATLLRDDYCDGLGDCLPVCPTGAITFEQRDTLGFDAAAVKANQRRHSSQAVSSGCPSSQAHSIVQSPKAEYTQSHPSPSVSYLQQWPIQIKLVPVNASYFENAKLLVAADCTAFAYGAFHQEYMKDRITLIGCPKLDAGDYAEKLTDILTHNSIRSIMVARMEVPCCGGMESAVKTALQRCQTVIPWQVVTISTDGHIIVEQSSS